LPKENLSPGELKQKEQYEAGIKAAREPRVIHISGAAGRMPWDYAKAMKPELINRKHEMVASSVGPGVPFLLLLPSLTQQCLGRLGSSSTLTRYYHHIFVLSYNIFIVGFLGLHRGR
jgi:hypothetical protein